MNNVGVRLVSLAAGVLAWLVWGKGAEEPVVYLLVLSATYSWLKD